MSSLFMRLVLTIALFYLLVPINFDAATQRLGILYQPAPSWGVSEWFQLKIPVGQSGSSGQLSQLMVRYRTGGTPWSILIDKNGIVQFNDFHIYEADAIRLIDGLIQSN